MEQRSNHNEPHWCRDEQGVNWLFEPDSHWPCPHHAATACPTAEEIGNRTDLAMHEAFCWTCRGIEAGQ